MIGRVTSQQLLFGSQRNIATAKSQLGRLQQQASSGLAISTPSDDPTGTAAVMRLRAEQRANTQYGTNIDDGLAWLATVDTSLSASEDLVKKAVDVAVQGANSGTMTPTSREALATQLDGIKADLLGQANTKYLGRSVFAGNSDAPAAFDSSYAYAGTPGSTVQRRISGTETVAVSGDGAAAFGTGSASVFAAVDAVAAALRSGDDTAVRAGLDTLRAGLATMTAEHAVVGGHYARMEQAKTTNGNAATSLETQRSGIEDADTAEVLLNLKTQELSYQTALGVTGQSIQPTLMSFLR